MQREYYTLGEIAEVIGAELQGDPACKIYSVAPLDKAGEGQISFFVNSRYQLVQSSRYAKYLPTTHASAVVLAPNYVEQCSANKLVLEDVHQGYVKLASIFEKKPTLSPGIHPSVVIGLNCQIADTVTIGPNCVIGQECVIGENTVIEANTVIKDFTQLGKDCYLHPNVTIYHNVHIGDRAVIHAGAIIGSEGFGMVRGPEGWKKIPHLGGVFIGNDVEVGACTTIDRGAIEDTIIENGVKLDNLIQLAHGVVIGENTVIAGCVGIAGSTRIGKNCMIGGLTGISDNIVIGDNVIFTGMSQVTKSITKPGIYSSGTGIFDHKAWHKNIARLHHLDDLARKLRKLEKEKNE